MRQLLFTLVVAGLLAFALTWAVTSHADTTLVAVTVDTDTLGEKLLTWRTEQQLTQIQAGIKVGVSGRIWGQWERGERTPTEFNQQQLMNLGALPPATPPPPPAPGEVCADPANECVCFPRGEPTGTLFMKELDGTWSMHDVPGEMAPTEPSP